MSETDVSISEKKPGVAFLSDVETPCVHRKPVYHAIKRAIDVVASACGLVILSPVLIGTAIAVKVTSPGPVVLKQKRVGIDKSYFQMYKFRTMRVDTPSEMPSHLINANDWVTPVGAALRKTSLDELPQLLNILKGDMTIVGPRPVLWNHFDLIAERDKYGANALKPGITGWAQINGRDRLDAQTKAALDGEYVRRQSLAFDAMCFFRTIGKVLSCADVVENDGFADRDDSEARDEMIELAEPSREGIA